MANRLLLGDSETMEPRANLANTSAWIRPVYNAEVKMLKVIMLRFPSCSSFFFYVNLLKEKRGR